jgi:hypothetical protein
MKIERNKLIRLIESYLNEEDKKGKYAVYFAARNISGTGGMEWLPESFKAGHSWVMVKKPGEGITSYSGKSGIVFTGSDFLKRYFLGRDLDIDEIVNEVIRLHRKGEIPEEELKDALKNADWKSLEKRKNWDSDTFDIANQSGNYLIEVMPRDGDTQEEVKAAAERIERAFENYNEGVPYDPLPGSGSGNPEARNSNSFAYTLLRQALGTPQKVDSRIGNPGMKLPGFDFIVAGMRSK